MRLYNFDDVMGNSNIVTVIRQSLANNTFPQISIFSGVYGTGKSTCAEIVGLALTCNDTVGGNPCLRCPNCQATLRALQTTAISNSVVKINVGQKNTKADVDEMIKDIFILKASDNRIVYIIEEAHSLSESQQTALLEELDKIPKGVYVIFCTTRLTKLLPELRSRAINYAFTRITDKDAEQLLDRLCLKNMFPLDKESKRIIINNSRGIPRQITNLFDFVKNGQYKSETLASFLGVISETDFINLLESMSSDDMFLYTNTLDQYMKTYSLDAFIEQLKDFILRVVFLMEGNIADGFEETDISRLRNIFRNIDITKVATIISNISNHTGEADFKFAMLKLRQLMHNKNISNIVNENAITAVTQSGKAKQLSSEISHYKKVEQNENAMKPLNVAYLNQFGGDA